jgi:hypothetical protein
MRRCPVNPSIGWHCGLYSKMSHQYHYQLIIVRTRTRTITIMTPKQLNFITGNKNKFLESKAILGDTVDLQSQALDLVEIQGTIEQISTDKCRRAAEYVSPLLARFYDSLTPFRRSKAPYLLRIPVSVSMP